MESLLASASKSLLKLNDGEKMTTSGVAKAVLAAYGLYCAITKILPSLTVDRLINFIPGASSAVDVRVKTYLFQNNRFHSFPPPKFAPPFLHSGGTQKGSRIEHCSNVSDT